MLKVILLGIVADNKAVPGKEKEKCSKQNPHVVEYSNGAFVNVPIGGDGLDQVVENNKSTYAGSDHPALSQEITAFSG